MSLFYQDKPENLKTYTRSDVEKIGAIKIYRCRYIYCEMTMLILQWIIIFVLCMHSPDTCTPTAILVHFARDMR